MTEITRDPQNCSTEKFDLIIVGGGIYGAMLALTASQMGLKNLLVEKGDFGGATTFNHLRTVHGGLRYLQTLDLPRFSESVKERHWFLKNFPDLTCPLPCLMPLYGNGPFRPSVFRVVLALNDLLSRHRNDNVPEGQILKRAKVISPETVRERFPLVDTESLKGGALWYDGGMPSPQLVLMAMIRSACSEQTTALNYTKATMLLVDDSRQTTGVHCVDMETGTEYDFHSAKVINAAGPWCRKFAASFDKDDPELFRYSIAWNVLFNKPALSDCSLAVRAKRPGGRMYFVHGFNGKIMGGTTHSTWTDPDKTPMPTAQEVGGYIDDLNLSIPGLHLKLADTEQVFAGLLPVQVDGTDKLASREIICDHGSQGGPKGAYSVSGVKFTTARLVAEKTLKLIFPQKPQPAEVEIATLSFQGCKFPAEWSPEGDNNWQEELRTVIEQQSVIHLDDLLLRRTSLGDNPSAAMNCAPQAARLFDWDEQRRAEETARLLGYFKSRSFSSEE